MLQSSLRHILSLGESRTAEVIMKSSIRLFAVALVLVVCSAQAWDIHRAAKNSNQEPTAEQLGKFFKQNSLLCSNNTRA